MNLISEEDIYPDSYTMSLNNVCVQFTKKKKKNPKKPINTWSIQFPQSLFCRQMFVVPL